MKNKKNIKNLAIGAVIMLGTLAINMLSSYQTTEEMREMIKEELDSRESSEKNEEVSE